MRLLQQALRRHRAHTCVRLVATSTSSILRRFEEMGAVTREVVHTPGKPDKHVYHMTDRGAELLQDLLCDFPLEQARDDVGFQVRVGFFHLLEPAARLAILTMRESALREWQVYLEHALAQARDRGETLRFAQRLIEFNQQSIQRELDWIVQLRAEVVA